MTAKTPTPTKVICITGMHRSGTSLVASWLERCGLTIHDGRSMGAYPGNPKGHFEDEDFVDLQRKAVLAVAPDSLSWKVPGLESLEFGGELLHRAKNLIAARNSKYETWGWKDPRSVLFLEQWKKLIPSMKAVLVWRDCFEVVTSLLNRSREGNAEVQISLSEATALWVGYNQRLCAHKRISPDDTILLNVETFLRNDAEVLRTINQKFGCHLEYQPIGQLYEPASFHRQGNTADLAGSRQTEVDQAQEQLTKLSDVRDR